MRNFFKNLSTFRLLVIFLLIVAAALYLHGRYSMPEDAYAHSEDYRMVYDTLLECADSFGAHLNAQESMAIALAMQVEMLPDAYNSDMLGNLLKIAMNNSPDDFLGLGVSLPGINSETRMVALTTRHAEDHSQEELAYNPEKAPPHTVTGQRGDRKMSWSLIINPPNGGLSRFSSRLAVSIRTASPGGYSVVRSDLRWLADILRKMGEVAGDGTVCVTPQMEALWLHNDKLVSDNEYTTEDKPHGGSLVERALRYARNEGGGNPPEFLRADILGTGWQLMVADPRVTAVKRESLSVTFIFIIIAIAAFALERLLSILDHAIVEKIDNNLTPAPLVAPPMPKKDSGLGAMLGKAYQFLFQYRITNPNQERIDSELRVARQIQFSLVPDSFPSYSEWREFDLYSILSPAREVGGDYYDFFMLNPNRLVLCVGDVSGKGIPAALYMAVCRTAFRSLARQNLEPGELMGRFNDMLVRDNNSGLYITLASFFVDLPTGSCEYVLAGHPAPLLYRAEHGRVETVDNPRETFAGMKAGIVFPTGSLTMNSGDTLLLYSDGVNEARNAAGDELAYEGVAERFADLNGLDRCRDLILGMEKSVREYMVGGEQEDDITLLAFRYWGPGGQKLRQRRGKISSRINNNAQEK